MYAKLQLLQFVAILAVCLGKEEAGRQLIICKRSVDLYDQSRGRSITSRNGGLEVTMLRGMPTFMDTLTFIGFELTDTVESVADPDWKRVVYML